MYQQLITRGQPFICFVCEPFEIELPREIGQGASCICFEEMLSTPHETTWRGLLQSFGLLKTSKMSQHESLEQVNQEPSYNILHNILQTAIESWRLILPISMMLKPKSLVFTCFHTMFLHPIVDPSRCWKKPWIQGIPGPCHSPARHWACSRRDQPAWRSTWDRPDPPGGDLLGSESDRFEASKWMARLRCVVYLCCL